MMSLGAGLPYLLIMALTVAFLWGSILAMRGRRWWATVMMLTGSAMQVVGGLMMVVGMVGIIFGMRGMGRSGDFLEPVQFVVLGGMILMALGFAAFGAGFIGFCARSGAAERRAEELEGLVSQLQERVGG